MTFSGSLAVLAITAPLWLPIGFMAFSVGRKRLSVRMVVLLTLCEVAALGFSYSVMKIYFTFF